MTQQQPNSQTAQTEAPAATPAALPPDVKRGVIQTLRALFRYVIEKLKQSK